MKIHNPTLFSIIAYNFTKIITNQYKFLIDFQGLMYFDDQYTHKNARNLIKDKKFIQKFYKSLQINQDQSREYYRYVGEFWGQRNYLRYSNAPIIFTTIDDGELQYSIGLRTKFQPTKLFIDQHQQLCYPYTSEHTTLKGVFSNQLSAHLLPMLTERQGQTILLLDGKEYQLKTNKNIVI